MIVVPHFETIQTTGYYVSRSLSETWGSYQHFCLYQYVKCGKGACESKRYVDLILGNDSIFVYLYAKLTCRINNRSVLNCIVFYMGSIKNIPQKLIYIQKAIGID